MEKKERVSKKKLLKVLKGCHQSENATVLAILERLKFKIFLVKSKVLLDGLEFQNKYGMP